MALNLTPVATPVGATVSSPGLGSGINVSQLVTSLVNATITPQQTLLQNQQATDQANISALGAVQSALFGLQASVGALTTGGALGDLTANPFSTFIFDLQARVTLALQISDRQERLRRRASKQSEGAVTP